MTSLLNVFLNYEKGLAGNENNYNFDKIAARVTHTLTLGNKGEMQINSRAGKFFNAPTERRPRAPPIGAQAASVIGADDVSHMMDCS